MLTFAVVGRTLRKTDTLFGFRLQVDSKVLPSSQATSISLEKSRQQLHIAAAVVHDSFVQRSVIEDVVAAAFKRIEEHVSGFFACLPFFDFVIIDSTILFNALGQALEEATRHDASSELQQLNVDDGLQTNPEVTVQSIRVISQVEEDFRVSVGFENVFEGGTSGALVSKANLWRTCTSNRRTVGFGGTRS